MKKNIVKACLSEYLILLRGEEKSGKTTFYSDLVKEFYGTPDAGFLIPFETGYKALNGLNVFDHTITPTKNFIYNPDTDCDEEYTGWKLFTTVIDDLVENRKENGVKVVCIDTIDRFYDVAIEEVMRLSRIDTKKACKSLNEAFGGFGRGKEVLFRLVKGQLQRLRDSGYGIVIIGHVKHKNIKDKIQQEEYQVLGSNLNEDMDKAIANDADFILMISNEKNVNSDKMVVGSQRYLRFRGDGYYSAGSRFQHLPEKIELSAKGFIDSFNAAVKSASGATDEELDELRRKQQEARAKEAEASALRDATEGERLFTNIRKHFDESSDVIKGDMVKRFAEYGINPKSAELNKVESLRAFAEIYGL